MASLLPTFLRPSSAEPAATEGRKDGGSPTDTATAPAANGAEAEMAQFSAGVAGIESRLDNLRRAVERIQELHQESTTTVKASSAKALGGKLKLSVTETAKSAREVKAEIEALSTSNINNRKKPGCQAGSSVDRQRTAITRSLCVKLDRIVREFSAVRERIQAQEHETLQRRVRITTGVDLSSEDVDDLVRSGKGEEVLRRAVELQGGGNQQAAITDALREVDERRGEIADLARDLQELNQLFVDMAMLVESQGETLDQIEVHVEAAVEDTRKGVAQLGQAWQIRKNTRKWQVIGAALVLVLTVIVALGVYYIVMKISGKF